MAINDVWKVTLVFEDTNLSRQMSTGYYLHQIGLSDPSAAVANAVSVNWWENELNSSGLTAGESALHADDLELVDVKLRKWDPLAPTETSDTTGLPSPGADASGQEMPPQNAILVSLRTANIGRSYRGRLYLPPPSESQVNDQLLLTSADACAAQFAGLCQEWDARTSDRCEVVVYSKLLTDYTVVTSVRVDANIRAQRRRNAPAPTYEISPV